MMSCSPSVMATPIKLSPSLSSMARSPLARRFLNCDNWTRFTIPDAVAKNTYLLSFCLSSSVTGKMAVTFSSASSAIRLTIGRPREPRLAIGTSNTCNPNTRPRSVKIITLLCVDVTTIWSMTSSAFMAVADLPLPPRFWAI